MTINEIAAAAKRASIQLAAVKTDAKNNALAEIARALKQHSSRIYLLRTPLIAPVITASRAKAIQRRI